MRRVPRYRLVSLNQIAQRADQGDINLLIRTAPFLFGLPASPVKPCSTRLNTVRKPINSDRRLRKVTRLRYDLVESSDRNAVPITSLRSWLTTLEAT